jgi:hypothetical protein
MTDDGEFVLTSNSLDAAKARWECPEGIGRREAFRSPPAP